MPRATEAARDVCSRCGRGVRADRLDGAGRCLQCAGPHGWRGPLRQRTRCPLCERRYARDGYPCVRCQVADGVRALAVAEWIDAALRGDDSGPFPAEPPSWRHLSPDEAQARARELVTAAHARQRRGPRFVL